MLYNGFCSSTFSLAKSVSSGVDVRGPSTYFIKAFLWGWSIRKELGEGVCVAVDVSGKNHAFMGVGVFDTHEATTSFAA
eukprot:15353009-Ditylum_brightwellii.AAC.1